MNIESCIDVTNVESKNPSEARRLGSYYTPELTAAALVTWAIRSGHERILEPSAGGGALISAAFVRASSITTSPHLYATAFDIDEAAIKKLQNLPIVRLDVLHEDFLDHFPTDRSYDLVLANPPFNRNHSLTSARRQALRARSAVPGAIGLWGHFLIHSLKFLRIGGRVASIVPRSVLFTAHGSKFLRDLCTRFTSVGVYELTNRPEWSNYADEAGAVILADGFQSGSCAGFSRGFLRNDGTIQPSDQLECEHLARLVRCSVGLGEIATLSIGAVTGRNSVFLLSEEERIIAGIPLSDVCPVVSRSRQLRGVQLTLSELEDMAEEGQKTWLLTPSVFNDTTRKHLSIISKDEIESVHWFRKRSPWWKIQVPNDNDAVFTYMNDLGPRIVQVAKGITCTNTLHCIRFFKGATAAQKRAAVLTPISSFGQLMAERLGRSYGGGVLKFELTEARKLPICIESKFSLGLVKKVDSLLKSGDHVGANILVDKALMLPIFGPSWMEVREKIRFDLGRFRELRRGFKKTRDSDE